MKNDWEPQLVSRRRSALIGHCDIGASAHKSSQSRAILGAAQVAECLKSSEKMDDFRTSSFSAKAVFVREQFLLLLEKKFPGRSREESFYRRRKRLAYSWIVVQVR